MARNPVFDPSRLDDDDLEDLLPPPPGRPLRAVAQAPDVAQPGEGPQPTAEPEARQQPPAARATPPRGSSSPAARRARGNGGRPPAEAPDQPRADPAPSATAGMVTVVPARIPSALWQSVVDGPLAHRERPSYAQLLAWTLEDHATDVLRRLRANLAPDRTPRGRRPAAPVNAIAVRFRPEELALLDGLISQVQADEATRVTRTAAIIATLQVALDHPPPTTTT